MSYVPARTTRDAEAIKPILSFALVSRIIFERPDSGTRCSRGTVALRCKCLAEFTQGMENNISSFSRWAFLGSNDAWF